MRQPYTFLSLVVIFFALPFAAVHSQLPSQQNKGAGQIIIKGERPLVDLARIPDSAMETGRIQVKFGASLGTFLENLSLTADDNNIVKFGIPAVDNLNNIYKVSAARRTFSTALETTQFAERHRQWGFHLWFDLVCPSGTDLREMVKAYQSLAEITIAEPVYKVVTDPRPVKSPVPALPANKSAMNFIPSDTLFGNQWHYNNTGQFGGTPDADIDLPEAWEITKGDTNVVVAIIDDGVDYMHPDIAGNMWYGRGYNFSSNTPVIVPGEHGTHVAGTVAANTNNVTGVSGVAGGSGSGNGVRLMSCQVLELGSQGSSAPFANAPVWAADHGAAISQNSWWYPTAGSYDQSSLDAIDYFNAHGGGTKLTGGITIACAGNSYTPGLYYPGCYSGVVGVAATNYKDMKGSYSTYDIWVDIAAPGGDYLAGMAGGVLSTFINGTYGNEQGTSMACPHVSGVAALIVSLAQGPITAQEVRDILCYSTDNIDSVNVQYLGKLGSGRLNALKALQLAPSYINPAIPKPVLNLTASAIGGSQVNLGWSLNNAADTVIVAFNTTGVFGVPTGNYLPGAAIAGGGTILCIGKLTSFNHSSLTPATKYYYAAWSKNGTNYAVVPAKAIATTQCTSSYSLPFNAVFNSVFFPVCWSQQNFGTGAIPKWFGSGTAHAGGTACEMMSISQAVNPGTTRLISPALNTIGYSQLNLAFSHMLDAKAAGATLKVQSSPDGIAWSDEAWSAATTATDIMASTVNTIIINNLNNATTYIAFTITGNLGQYDYWYIDNVSVTVPVGNPPIVTTTAISAIGITSATSGGNVTLAGTTDVTARGVCWGTAPNPNILGNHTLDGAGLGVYSSTLNGLLPNTTYHVRAYATNNTGTSYGANIQFTTLCDMVNVFPFSQGFENAGLLPSCWSQEALAGSTILWNFITGNGGTGPSTAHTGTYNACLKDNNAADTKTRLITPRLNLLSISSPQLRFWHTQAVFITYQDRLSVYYRNSAAGPWLLLASYATNIPTWTQEIIILPNPTNDYYIAFEGNAKRGNGVCIDDVEVTGTLPATVSLQNMTIGSSHCYNALQTIEVAGNGTTFSVQNGGSATLIAGQNIIFYPGTMVDSGGYLNGYITTNGQYCGTIPPMMPSLTAGTEEQSNGAVPSFFSIYPNPASGEFTVDLTGRDPFEQAEISIYGMTGEKVFSTFVSGKNKYQISLAGNPAGIYLVRVSSGMQAGTRKMLKH